MSHANPLWGAPRIHGELLKVGIDVSQATVAKYMIRAQLVGHQFESAEDSCVALALFQCVRPSAGSFISRSLFDSTGDGPYMSSRINHRRDAISPELVLERNQNLRSVRDGSINRLIDVFDVNEEHNR